MMYGAYSVASPRNTRARIRAWTCGRTPSATFSSVKGCRTTSLRRSCQWDQSSPASLTLQPQRSRAIPVEVLRTDLLPIQQCKDSAVCKRSAKLLHEIKTERRPSGAILVEKADRRIESSRQ